MLRRAGDYLGLHRSDRRAPTEHRRELRGEGLLLQSLQEESSPNISQMLQNGMIFSDDVESDYLAFDPDVVASISVVEERARFVAA